MISHAFLYQKSLFNVSIHYIILCLVYLESLFLDEDASTNLQLFIKLSFLVVVS